MATRKTSTRASNSKSARPEPKGKVKVTKGTVKKAAPGDALAKARAARLANAKAGKKGTATKARSKLPIFKAPEGFKPHFIELSMKTEKDGLLGGRVKAIRIKGQYNLETLRDENMQGRKWWDLGSFNPEVLNGLVARFGAKMFVTNAAKRLPANTTYKVLIRVGKKSADDSLSATIKWVKKLGEVRGKKKLIQLENKDPEARRIKGAKRFLPAAFVATVEPPVQRGRRKASKDEE